MSQSSFFEIRNPSKEEFQNLYCREKQLRRYYQQQLKQLRILQKKAKLAKPYIDKPKDYYNHVKNSQKVTQQLIQFQSHINKKLQNLGLEQENLQQSNSQLFQNFVIYGIPDYVLFQQVNKLQWNSPLQLLFCANNPSNSIMQFPKMLYPQGIQCLLKIDKEPLDIVQQIINQNYNNLKSFIVSFPPIEQKKKISRKKLVSNQYNPLQKQYAICFQIPEFTCISEDKSITSTLYSWFNKPKQMLKITSQTETDQQDEKTQKIKSIIISKKVICFFTKNPISSFFQSILKDILNAVKIEKMINFSQDNQNHKQFGSEFQTQAIKKYYFEKVDSIQEEFQNFLGSIQVQVNSDKHILEDLQQHNIKKSINYSINIWLPQILDLFDHQQIAGIILTLLAGEPLVFVCSNVHILTYAIHLFSQILIRPFQYCYKIKMLSGFEQEPKRGEIYGIQHGNLQQLDFIEIIDDSYLQNVVILQPQKCIFLNKNDFSSDSLFKQLRQASKSIHQQQTLKSKRQHFFGKVQKREFGCLAPHTSNHQQIVRIIQRTLSSFSKSLCSKSFEFRKWQLNPNNKTVKPNNQRKKTFVNEIKEAYLTQNGRDCFEVRFVLGPLLSSHIQHLF